MRGVGRWCAVADEGWWEAHLNPLVVWPSQSHPCVRGKALEPSFSITSVCEGESARTLGYGVFSITSSKGGGENAGRGIGHSMGMLG
ncbi:uncharacterized protein YALI1_F18664g [Yarrowia lipolytica]|uniref:Uncharacterized protein n=1 Tax=Yarrowia lipolytica TaxID=4952 RepID=A0A1D8NNC4_YARLL|nr:hypothetical protein YALI1_F18664g [Yarrowia lipolytica]